MVWEVMKINKDIGGLNGKSGGRVLFIGIGIKFGVFRDCRMVSLCSVNLPFASVLLLRIHQILKNYSIQFD